MKRLVSSLVLVTLALLVAMPAAAFNCDVCTEGGYCDSDCWLCGGTEYDGGGCSVHFWTTCQEVWPDRCTPRPPDCSTAGAEDKASFLASPEPVSSPQATSAPAEK